MYDLWREFGYGLSILTIVLYVKNHPQTLHSSKPTIPNHKALILILTVLALLLRLSSIDKIAWGRPIQDEMSMSRTYVGYLLDLKPIYSGATQAAYGGLLAIWYRLMGYSITSARILSSVVGALACCSCFLMASAIPSIRHLSSTIAILLAMSVGGVYFSQLGIETGSVLFTLPLILFLLILSFSKKSVLLGLIAGSFLGISIFTYPGLIIGLLSLVLAITINFLCHPYAMKKMHTSISISVCLSLALFCSIGLNLQTRMESGPLLFVGGGSADNNFSLFFPNLLYLIFELLISSDSWLTNFQGFPFLEPALMGASLIGIKHLKRKTHTKRISNILLLSVGISIVLCSLSGNAIGVRRTIWILLPYYIFVAAGLKELIYLQSKKIFYLIIILFSHGIIYYWAKISPFLVQPTELGPYKSGYQTPLIPDSIFVDALFSYSHVALSPVEFPNIYDQYYYIGFRRVIDWCTRNDHKLGELNIESVESFLARCSAKANSNAALLTRSLTQDLNNKFHVISSNDSNIYILECIN